MDSSNGALSHFRVSVKANFDVKGYPTCCGTTLLADNIAQEDAKAVQRLKHAGAQLVGHTNMTELAYSGLGLNPHYGTPENPIVEGAIPGGSTSGGAVSVATGEADIALGTDTGGSLRIPAAFCGVTGFKPSQQSVSSQGCWPLSQQLDSVGPIGKSVSDCRLVWEVISNSTSTVATDKTSTELEFVIPKNFGFDEIDPEVAELFDQAVSIIEAAGFMVRETSHPLFEDYKKLPVWHFSAVESRHFYQSHFDTDSADLDPRVRSRIRRGVEIDDVEFEETKNARRALIDTFSTHFANKVFLMPTVVCKAPKFADLVQDADYDRINLLCLRNTTLANVLDGCSISLPFWGETFPIGIMLTMVNGADERLLEIAQELELIFANRDR
ncbi:amidase family protein [Vibrio maritimus]|uniref:amidase family protein n=1 Tax=Vibrio maritimus TaxID=990268 RepID=UPI0037350B12